MFPTAACQWHLALRDVFNGQSNHLSTPSLSLAPSWVNIQSISSVRTLVHCRPADLKSSSNVSIPIATVIHIGPHSKTPHHRQKIINLMPKCTEAYFFFFLTWPELVTNLYVYLHFSNSISQLFQVSTK